MFILELYITENANSVYILVIIHVDTSTNCAQIISVTDNQHGWSKCPNNHCTSEVRFLERQTVHMAEILCT